MQYKVGDWLVVANENKLTNRDGTKSVEPKVMTLLMYLCQHPEEVKSVEQLLADVWPDRVVTEASIYQTIAQLRKALGDKASQPHYIVTVPKKGYKLIAPVDLVEPKEGATPTKESRAITQSIANPLMSVEANIPLAEQQAKVQTDKPSRQNFWPWQAKLFRRARWLGALVLVIVAVILNWHFPTAITQPSQVATIAILPFQHLGLRHDPQQMAQVSARGLSYLFNRVTNLDTVSFTSSEAAARSGGSAVDIADTLDADYLVEGQVEVLASGTFHLEVSLIRGEDGIQIWSGGRDVNPNQQEQVHLDLIKQMLAALDNKDLKFKDTHALHRKANALIAQHTPAAYDEAINLLLTVTQFDDQNSQAFAELSQLYLAKYNGEQDKQEWLTLAKQHLYRSLSIAPGAAHSLIALAQIQFDAGDYRQARQSLSLVLGAEPENLMANLILISCHLAEQKLYHAKRVLLTLAQDVKKDLRVMLLNAIVAIQMGHQVNKHLSLIDKLINAPQANPMPYHFSELAINTALLTGAHQYALSWSQRRLQLTPQHHVTGILQSLALVGVKELSKAEQVLATLAHRPITETFSAYQALYLANQQQHALLALVERSEKQLGSASATSSFKLIHGMAALYAGEFAIASDKLSQGIKQQSQYEHRRLQFPLYYGSLAYSLSQQGRPVEAAKYRQLGLQQINALENDGVKLAQIEVLRARLYGIYNPKMAMHALGKAINAGYQDDVYLEQDLALISLHKEREFSALVAQARQNKQRASLAKVNRP
ncbi:winged helix-turn-helix domain-containing protein [Motilimonas eburnea]|uniref:winged helix-turn-helix domain-containing protein n=1 Tax=Motilimonas eburnea TaxID=1737488 RepID=UPI001E5036A6|nr:winged helix-turn-helix domain-containing protein [Motilimonas eburnea]MCE2570527.1 winged helix-turn-helix domain-containing protein [Motilimonas eburnea]